MPLTVLALPRGGVPVGFEVARALDCPLDVLIARKVGAPGNPELGIGAVAEGGVRVLSDETLRSLLVSEQELELGVSHAEKELRERVALYRGERPRELLNGRTVIVVDDGLATGGTALAAVRASYAAGANMVILAVPVGAAPTVAKLRAEVDAIVCLLEPEPLWAIGMWYEDFAQVPDAEVSRLLAEARARASAQESAFAGAQESAFASAQESASAPGSGAYASPRTRSSDPPVARTEVEISYEEGGRTAGDLAIPPEPRCLVLFAHGSGSSRRSPRNRQVAAAFNDRKVATLLFDLLTAEEELHRANIFDIELLSRRLEQATSWARAREELSCLRFGYFGASTGAAAALWAAANLRDEIGAVVSRGGRPDLAVQRLAEVRAAVLLVVGGADAVVLDLNRQALTQLGRTAELAIVPGATHLFEEPGALEEVAQRACDWFIGHLTARQSSSK